MIKFRCNHCNYGYEVPDTFANKTGVCTRCKQRIQIPAKSQDESVIKIRCPACKQKMGVPKQYAGKKVRCAKCKQLMRIPPPDADSAEISKVMAAAGDNLFEDNITEKMFASESREPSANEFTFKPVERPKSPRQEIERDISRGFGTADSEPVQSKHPEPTRGLYRIPLGLLASFGFTIGAAILWTIIAYFVGLRWVQFLCIAVAASAGYGLALFIEERGIGLGLIAVLIGLFGIFCGKGFLAEWVVKPRLQSTIVEKAETDENAQLTEEEIIRRCEDPNCLNEAALFQIIDSNEFEKNFAQKMPQPSFNFRELMSQSQQIATQTAAKAREMVSRWTPEQKRKAIIAQFERNKQMSRQMRPVKTLLTSVIAFICSFSLLDFIFIPVGLWSAYKIGAGG